MSGAPETASVPTVVIVEDDVALLQALRFMLLSEGLQAVTCETGEALLALELPEPPCCLVVDERLPGVRGLSALEALRERGVETPAFLITTDPGADAYSRAAAAGVQVIEKPLVGDVLLAAVQAALAAHGRT